MWRVHSGRSATSGHLLLLHKARCDFCGRRTPPFGDVDELFEYVYQCLLLEYGDPDKHGIIWDKEDGRYAGIRELDTYEVLYEVGDPLGDGSALTRSVAESIEHCWYLIGSEVGTIDERSVWSWTHLSDGFSQDPGSCSPPRRLTPTTHRRCQQERFSRSCQSLESTFKQTS